ncbi:DUF1127 domain-containing protein [Vannielia sp.]|uniref:DUF1127 domain-containing protein n=1 Tax=Vannielia sp. TaxID=2813045 RepID=UPI00260A80FB|nr:DUF1127 domain-containing protein [Vannielia sp.]MDF1871277.1 DUF1127 domain-containing protein [Vannielia sp.]
MATPATNADFAHHGFGARIGAGFSRVFGTLVKLAENNRRYKAAQEFAKMSDEELAKRGLTRADIARHVYGDMFYI